MTGTTMGSLSYMSPEQVKGEPTDARSDLYSVGVSLYEMVTGQRPFVATSDYSIMAAHVKEAPKPPVELHPGLPAALNEIILMSIAKDPALRFQSADAFRNALSSVPVTASPVVSQAALDASTVTSMQAPAMPSAAPAKPLAPASTPSPAAAVSSQAARPSVPPMPAPMPPPAQPGGHRGLYMTLGALIVLAVLVVAGIYVPRSSWTHAKSPDANAPTQTPAADTTTQSPTPSSQSTEMAAPVAAPLTTPADSSAGATNSTAPPAPPAPPTASVNNSNSMQPQAPPMAKSNLAHHAKKLAAQSGMAGEADAPAQGGEGAGSPGADTAQLDELEKTVDQLSNRAAAVNSGLDHLQQQQAASGYGLRSDMVERQASLKSNLYKAEEALQHHDVARAKKYADLAEGDAGVLERFLGH